eukprot:snap_masked-scaffold_19-processed-gene-0.18-mRNA-1 protein AED:1.00 eAED:1.00 QI:0/-1/0/0/-1/1/1/0/183
MSRERSGRRILALPIEERRKYFAKAAQRHRDKLEKQAVELKLVNKDLQNKVKEAKERCKNLVENRQDLEKNILCNNRDWNFQYLLAQNSYLSKRANELRKKRYILEKLFNLKLLYPKFDVVAFPQTVFNGVQQAIDRFSKIRVTKSGYIKWNGTTLKCSRRRARIRNDINKQRKHSNKKGFGV